LKARPKDGLSKLSSVSVEVDIVLGDLVVRTDDPEPDRSLHG
jgi:hypothetical protein